MGWVKFALFALLTAIFAWFGPHRLVIEQDILRSLAPKDAPGTNVFRYFEQSGVYKDKLFLASVKELPTPLTAQLEERIATAGYERYVPPLLAAGDFTRATRLFPLFFANGVGSLLTPARLDARADFITQLLQLPGGGALFSPADPLGLAAEALQFLGQRLKGPLGNHKITIYQRKRNLDYDRIGELYDFLLAQDSGQLHFLSGDFFALENYRAVQQDIHWVLWASLALNLALFFWFCPHPRLLLFFTAGTLVSYVWGGMMLRQFYPYVYALVLVFTSTFIGFNNEYLVHFSGIRRLDLARTAIGLMSAIGTTLIGFLVLIFAQNPIIRQIALVSLGGMLGFVLVMASYQKPLSEITYRTFRLPFIKWNKRRLIACWAVLLTIIGWCGHTGFRTDINDFRFSSPRLMGETGYFSRILESYAMGDMVALPCLNDSYTRCYARALQLGARRDAFHPMALYRDPAEQAQIALEIAAAEREAVPQLTRRLEQRGVFVAFHPMNDQGFKPLSEEDYLALFNDIGFFPFSFHANGERYLFVAQGTVPLVGAFPMSPLIYYNKVLTDLQTNMTWLFGVGLVAMAIFLIPLQRKLINILYIYLPLGAAIAVLLCVLHSLGGINFIHITGLALLIAIALDYSCILISNRFVPLQQSKVILTGLSSVLTFGLLALCRHPVMRDLGWTVALGSAVALAVAVFTRVDTPEEPSP